MEENVHITEVSHTFNVLSISVTSKDQMLQTLMLFWLTKTKTNIDFSYTTYILVIKTKTNLTMYEITITN